MEQRRRLNRKGVFLILLLVSDLTATNDPEFNRTVINVVRRMYPDLCPYTSTCTVNASKEFPNNVHGRPCCSPCSCEGNCVETNTCCIDAIPDPSYDDVGLRYGCVSEQLSGRVSTHTTVQAVYYYMVNVCISTNVENVTASKCSSPKANDLLDLVPVTSSSGLTFSNKYCAACAGVTDGLSWTPRFGIPLADRKAYTIYENMKGTTVNELLEYANEHPETLIIYAVPPEGFTNRVKPCQPSLVRECNVSGLWVTYDEVLEAACAMFGLPYLQYENIFCYLCNNNKMQSKFCSSLGGTGGKDHDFYELTGLINYRADMGTTEKGHIEVSTIPGSPCEAGQLFDYNKGGCRPWFCPYGYTKLRDDCRPLLRMIYGVNISFPLTFTVSENNENVPVTRAIFDKSVEVVKKLVSKIVKQRILLVHALTPTTSTTKHNEAQKYICIFCFVQVESGIDAHDLYPVITQALSHVTSSRFVLRYHERDLDLHLSPGSNIVYSLGNLQTNVYDAELDTPLISLSEDIYNKLILMDSGFVIPYGKLLYCKQVQLARDEYNDFGHKICITVSKRCFINRDFRYVDNITGTVRICADEYINEHRSPSSSYESIKRYLSVVLSVISGISVLVVIVTFALFRDICRPVTGKNNLLLCLSLLATAVNHSVQAAVTNNNTLCFITGILTHFFRLATFCWLNVCSFHLLKVFTTDQTLGPMYFIPYTALSFILPLVTVAANSYVSFVQSRGTHYGYGGNECFISSLAMTGLTFVAPTGLGLMVNVILYARIICTVSEQQYGKNDFTQGRVNPLMYLLVCCIAVVTCLSDFLFRLTEWYPLEFICLFASTGEGLVIFITFVCNRTLWNMYKILLGF